MTQDLRKDPVRKSMQARRRSGNSMIELTFMMPWLVFLFVGVFDFGFYAYALIATQNAARAAAVHNSISKAAATDNEGACQIVFFELKTAAYGRPMPTDCSSGILQVASTYETTGTPDGNPAAKVVVMYQTPLLMGIPGLIPSRMTITRTAWMRVNPSADF